jgi:hypothetical protein
MIRHQAESILGKCGKELAVFGISVLCNEHRMRSMAKTKVLLQQMHTLKEEKLLFLTMLAGRKLPHPNNQGI